MVDDGEAGGSVSVRKAIGSNIRRIRTLRGMKGQELVDRLTELGFSLPTSGLSEIETAKDRGRRVTAEELLIFAIALNTSVIDLLTPASGKPLKVADGVEPVSATGVESWLAGDHPWPLVPTNSPTADEFFATASDFRQRQHRTEMRPEMQEIEGLRHAVVNAIDGPGPLNQTYDPDALALQLRYSIERVSRYVDLLVDQLETQGNASR